MKKKHDTSPDVEDIRREEMSRGRRPIDLETRSSGKNFCTASGNSWKLGTRTISSRLCAL
jgi:hypothetical protein